MDKVDFFPNFSETGFWCVDPVLRDPTSWIGTITAHVYPP
jgi:hypothetical protein